MMKIQCLFLIIAFVSITSAFAQSSDSIPDIVARIKPSVVSVLAYDSSGKGVKSGSGFCVASNRIVTNKHVIEDAEKIVIRTSANTNFNVLKIESVDSTGDLALLKTEELGSQIKPLKIADYAPRVGEKILVLGNPKGLEGTVSDGIISAFRNVPSIGKLIQITAPISHGSSGSPVINMKGEVIAVATLNLEDGQNLNFAISSERIISLWSNILTKTESEPISNGATFKDKRWRLLTDEKVSYDTETFSEKLGLIRAWIQYKEADGSYSKVLTEINCKTTKIRSVESLDYNKTGGLVSSNYQASSWRNFVPDTKGEQMYKIFCKEESDYQSLQDRSDYIEIREKAGELWLSKKYEDLINTSKQIIQNFQEYPAYTEVGYYYISLAKKEQGKLQEAETFALKAINIEASEQNLNLLGEIYQAENNLPAAIDIFWKSLRKSEGDFFRSEFTLEQIYKKTKNYKGLTDLYKFLISHGKIEKYKDLADVYETQTLSTLAKSTRITGINALEKSIENGKADQFHYYALSQIYESVNNLTKAEFTLKESVAKFPNEEFAIWALADYYNRNKQWEKAVDFIKNALPRISNNSDKISLLKRLKNAYEKLGKLKDAEQVSIELEMLK